MVTKEAVAKALLEEIYAAASSAWSWMKSTAKRQKKG